MRHRERAVASVLLLCALASASAQNVPIATNTDDRFDRLDVNHDGVLSRYEVDTDVFVAALDTDHDGKINAAELTPMLGPDVTPAMALDRVRVADRNANDVLEDAEITRASEMRFNWLDANADGNVSREELQARFGVKMVGGP
jgi:Ca2+-binding EF-hand superfamily protein